MKDTIKPTTKPILNEKGEEEPIEFILEDKDYLLITAINNLTKELERGRTSGR